MTRDTAIVGGGPAGAALAIRLARAGRDVLLIERSEAPRDLVCGEFLSGEALDELAALGIDAAALGAVPLRQLRLLGAGAPAASALPFPAAGLTRRALDAALRAAAAAAGAEVRCGTAARSVSETAVLLADGRSLPARRVVLATGKHDLRGAPRPVDPARARWTGLKLHLDLAPAQDAALSGAVEMHLFAGGYAGLQCVEGRANLCVAAAGGALPAAARRWDSFVEALAAAAPSLRSRLAGAVPRGARPLAVAGVPYGHLHPPAASGPLRLGDQFGVIPSFCGDGIAIALCTARLAADAILAGQGEPRHVHAAARARLAGQFRRAALLSRGATSPAAARLFAAAARACPSLLREAARLTRIPDEPAPARPVAGTNDGGAATCLGPFAAPRS